MAPGVPVVLMGDGLRLNQVLINLINNAIKFTEEGRIALTVTSKPVTDEEVLLQVTVEDTGIGMDSSELARAFQPFAQGDASITRRYGGTGLGLVISRELLRLMRGELSVDSAKGRGTRFSVSVPIKLAPSGDAPSSLSDLSRQDR